MLGAPQDDIDKGVVSKSRNGAQSLEYKDELRKKKAWVPRGRVYVCSRVWGAQSDKTQYCEKDERKYISVGILNDKRRHQTKGDPREESWDRSGQGDWCLERQKSLLQRKVRIEIPPLREEHRKVRRRNYKNISHCKVWIIFFLLVENEIFPSVGQNPIVNVKSLTLRDNKIEL